MSFKDNYKEVRKLINAFIKKDYWHDFSSADIFYQAYGKRKTLLTFLDSFFGDSYGIQLFYNKEGFNYVHDIFTTSDSDFITIGDCDSICAVLIAKKDLKESEMNFLKENNFRIKDENNLIIYRFEKGYGQRLANAKELKILLDELYFISCLLEYDYNDVKEAFKKEYAAVSVVDNRERKYNVVYRPLPYLEEPLRKKPINVAFSDEFKDSYFMNDECYLFTSYLPVVIKENNVRPLLVYFYYPETGKSYFKYITSEPKDYKNCIWGILYEAFTNVGLPTKMYINDRVIYHDVVKTLEAFKMEVEFKKESINVNESINQFISTMYQSTHDEIYEEREALEILMDTIAKVMNSMSMEDYSDMEDIDNDTDTDTFVS